MNDTHKTKLKAKTENITAMLIFSTIGIFVKNIVLSSSIIAFVRGALGVAFLFIVMIIKRQKFDKAAVKHNIKLLVISGLFIGFNWIFLFESYKYTDVSVATLCYYMQPVFVTLMSPVVLKEKLTKEKIIAVLVSLVGMILVSGVMQNGIESIKEIKGIAFALGAAVLYACVVLLNKHMKDISSYDMSILQLFFASVTILPYIFLTEDVFLLQLSFENIIMLLILGIVHTGMAYMMYFDSLKNLSAQTAAFYSYIDPVGAVILSVILLNETMDIYKIIGAVLIIGTMLISEIYTNKKQGEKQYGKV